ncbi:MAG: hypothetical protein JSS32_09940 [Verrucomicrobia bacterium]|nr:hypothetical protein [Verrucomicrobiota bacterium]
MKKLIAWFNHLKPKTLLIGGAALLLLGLILIVYGVQSAHELAEAKGFVGTMKNAFREGGPVASFFTGAAEKRLAKYNAPIILILILGTVSTAAGAISLLSFFRKRKNR